MKVTIRPLTEDDAAISYTWRNNPEIWKYTGSQPNKPISLEDELNWARIVLRRSSEKRFAICISPNDRYIGNIQLTHINKNSAQLHLFIGEIEYHGKGIGTKSTQLILDYSFFVLKLKSVYLYVNKKNIGAVKVYRKCGFIQTEETDDIIKMEILQENHQK